MLNTGTRTRPVFYTPYEEKQRKELEKMKKHHIKANPVNYKILVKPPTPTKFEKRETKPEPFNLTEPKEKKVC